MLTEGGRGTPLFVAGEVSGSPATVVKGRVPAQMVGSSPGSSALEALLSFTLAFSSGIRSTMVAASSFFVIGRTS